MGARDQRYRCFWSQRLFDNLPTFLLRSESSLAAILRCDCCNARWNCAHRSPIGLHSAKLKNDGFASRGLDGIHKTLTKVQLIGTRNHQVRAFGDRAASAVDYYQSSGVVRKSTADVLLKLLLCPWRYPVSFSFAGVKSRGILPRVVNSCRSRC
jgi:hypothetical protein